jgi:hypothetical protein
MQKISKNILSVKKGKKIHLLNTTNFLASKVEKTLNGLQENISVPQNFRANYKVPKKPVAKKVDPTKKVVKKEEVKEGF